MLQKKTCMNLVFGGCKNCTENRSLTNRPNNMDCHQYREMTLFILEDKNVKIKKN